MMLCFKSVERHSKTIVKLVFPFETRVAYQYYDTVTDKVIEIVFSRERMT